MGVRPQWTLVEDNKLDERKRESKMTRALIEGCDQMQQHKQRGKMQTRIRRQRLKDSWTQAYKWNQNEGGAKAVPLQRP